MLLVLLPEWLPKTLEYSIPLQLSNINFAYIDGEPYSASHCVLTTQFLSAYEPAQPSAIRLGGGKLSNKPKRYYEPNEAMQCALIRLMRVTIAT
jgi:hypothetical protein